MSSRAHIFAISALLLSLIVCVTAVNADMHLVAGPTEIMAGLNGDANIQFVKLGISSQNCQKTGTKGVGHFQCVFEGQGAKLTFFNAAGIQTGEFLFPENTPPIDISQSVLVGTQQFANLSDSPPPDHIMPPLVVPDSGRVCYTNQPLGTPVNFCVSYGPTTINGPLPITGNQSLKSRGDFTFALGTPAPQNKCGATSKLHICPVANGQTVTTPEDTSINIILTGSDLEAGPLKFAIVDIPFHGTLNGTPPNLTYIPFPNFNGIDSFTFRVNNGILEGAATVFVNVTPANDAPTAAAQTVTTNRNTSVNIVLFGTDFESDALTFSIVSPPTHGMLGAIAAPSCTANGCTANVIYTPDANFVGVDSFTFRVNDGVLDSVPGTMSIRVRPALTVTIAGTGAGFVSSNPFAISCGSVCSRAFDPGTTVTLTAAPQGSTFDGWSGGGCSGTGTCIVTVNDDVSVTAKFTVNACSVTPISIGESKSGALGISDCIAPHGTGSGGDLYTFSGTAGHKIIITMTSGSFSPRLVLVNPDATTTTGSFCLPPGGACLPTNVGSSAFTLPQTGTYTIEATSNSSSPVAGNYTLALLPVFSLTVNKTGAGTVTSSPMGMNCGSICTGFFSTGTTVTLTATSTTGSSFGPGWTGAGCSGTNTCNITMNDNISVTAAFTDNSCSTSSIAFGETKTGTLANSDCPAPHRFGSVADLYSFGGTAGQRVIISMNSTVPPTFAPFIALQNPSGTTTISSSCSSASAACVPSNGANGGAFILPETGTYTIEASSAFPNTFGNYSLTLSTAFSLTINKSGSGSGTVTSVPIAINCGSGCSGFFAPGASVSLTANPANGSNFNAGWSGAGCSGSGVCTVVINADTSVTADFSVNVCSTRAIAVGETKTGSVNSSDCAAPHRNFSLAHLYTFSGTAGQKIAIIMSSAFSPFVILQKPDGTVAASNSSCAVVSQTACIPFDGSLGGTFTLPVTGSYTIEATSGVGSYTLKIFTPVTLTIAKSGTGRGSITSNPSGIVCDPTCAGSFPNASSVTLTAVPSPGSSFDHWVGGNCVGNGVCVASVDSDMSIAAIFASNACTMSPLAFGDTKSATLAGSDCISPHRPGSVADVYTFSGTAGQKIKITMSSATFATDLILQDPSNNVIVNVSSCSASSFGTSCVPSTAGSLVLPTTGAYTVEATSLGSGVTGAYTLNMVLCCPPVANAQTIFTTEDTPLNITLGGSDPDGDPITYSVVTNPAHGKISGDPPNLTYTPESNFHGSDSFTFKVHDGIQPSPQATVSISVLAANDTPTADAGSDQTVAEGALVTLDGSSSTDPDGDNLTFAWTQIAGSPTVTLTGASTSKPTFRVPFVPPSPQTKLTFQLTVTDSGGLTSTDTVDVDVIPMLLDHFRCYTGVVPKAAKGQPPLPKFTPRQVTLSDDFGTIAANVVAPLAVCTPADKNNEGVVDQTTHLEAYSITNVSKQKFAPKRNAVSNQLGTLVVDATRIDRLLVPTSKAVGTTPPAAPDLDGIDVDHYECYAAIVPKAAKGQPPFPAFRPVNVSVEDQFGTWTVTLTAPARLCNPVKKNSEEIKNTNNHLMCYAGVMPRTTVFPKQVALANQFGTEVLNLTAGADFCVPSVTAPSP